jgi:hypothetical protein
MIRISSLYRCTAGKATQTITAHYGTHKLFPPSRFPRHSRANAVLLPRPVILNRRATARYRALASIIPGPRLVRKRIYRAAVSQSLRTTVLDYRRRQLRRSSVGVSMSRTLL